MAVFDANIARKQFHKQSECIVGKVVGRVRAYVYRQVCIQHQHHKSSAKYVNLVLKELRIKELRIKELRIDLRQGIGCCQTCSQKAPEADSLQVWH